MRVAAVDLYRHLLAELLPARAAVIALRAALVVVHHHPGADARLLLRYARANRRHHAAWFMPGDHRIRIGRKSRGVGSAARFWPAVLVQIAAAHAGSLHLDDDLVWAGRRIGELHHLKLAPAGENDTTHCFLLPGSIVGC